MSEQRYRVGSERRMKLVAYREPKTGELHLSRENPNVVLTWAETGDGPRYILELVKDFDVVEPVTADDAVKLAKSHLGTLHYPCGNHPCTSCAIARDILERAGAQ